MAYYNRGTSYGHRGDYDRAIVDLGKSIRFNRKYAPAYDNRAWAHERLGNWDEVISDTTRALQIKKWALPFNRRGRAYAEKGEYDRAIADMDRAIAHDPRFADAYDNRAWVYELKRD